MTIACWTSGQLTLLTPHLGHGFHWHQRSQWPGRQRFQHQQQGMVRSREWQLYQQDVAQAGGSCSCTERTAKE